MPWYERLIDFFFIDLINVFIGIGANLFISLEDLIPGLSDIPDLVLFGFNIYETPLIGFLSAYVIYLFIGIRIVRLVVGG